MFVLSVGWAEAPGGGGGNIFCKDLFPGTCTQGGCGAEGGWWGNYCEIKCSETLIINCQFGQK